MVFVLHFFQFPGEVYVRLESQKSNRIVKTKDFQPLPSDVKHFPRRLTNYICLLGGAPSSLALEAWRYSKCMSRSKDM